MMRLLAVLIMSSLASPSFAQQPAKGFRTEPDEGSRAAMVEYGVAWQMKFYTDSFLPDNSRDMYYPLSLVFSLHKAPGYGGFDGLTAFEDFGKPSPFMAVLLKHSGRSRIGMALLLAAEHLREKEIERQVERMSALEAAIDRRAGKPMLDAAEDYSERADALTQERRKLSIEAKKFRASAGMYAEYAALLAKAEPSDAELRVLAKLERDLGKLTAAEATEFSAYMERMARIDENLRGRHAFECLYWTAKAAYLRSGIKPLAGEALAADQRDRAELARLEASHEKLVAGMVTLESLIPDTPAAREAFWVDWSEQLGARHCHQFYHAESPAGGFAIGARICQMWVDNRYLQIGVDGPHGRIKLSGTDALRVSSPDVKAFAKIEPDFAATMRAAFAGRSDLVAKPAVDVSFIEMPLLAGSKNAGVDFDVDDGVDVDLRELNTQNLSMTARASGRYLFSETANRNATNRLTLAGHPLEKPTIISIPSSIKLEAGKTLFLNAGELLLRLDCVVTARLDGDKKPDSDTPQWEAKQPNIDIELRETGKQSLRIAVIHKGKPLFADAKALAGRLEAAKKEMARE